MRSDRRRLHGSRLLLAALAIVSVTLIAPVQADTTPPVELDSVPAKDADLARVNAYLADLQTLQARFHQLSLDDRGQTLAAWSGTLYLQRPGRFRWEYTEPYEQSVVADGERLWIFDSELEQATVKKLDASLASNPAMLLSGSANVDDAFEIAGSYITGDTRWIALKPRAPDTDFQAIRLGFDGDQLTLMELIDSLDQTTRIEFSDIRRNVAISPAQFVFEVPSGVDVIGDDPLYEAAIGAARDAGQVSASLLGQRLSIDNQRAAGLISTLRDNGYLVAGETRGAFRFRESP